MQKIVKQSVSFINNYFIAIVLLILTFYALLEIFRSSFVIGDVRYFSLFDDEMISMRYARNLSEGIGLVWNPNEQKVEGFTNPLWVFIMALVHLLPIHESKISLTIQLFNVILLLLNVGLVHRVAKKISNKREVIISTVLLTAFYYPLLLWGILGTEVGFVTALILLSVSLTISRKIRSRNIIISFFLLSLATVVRMDAIVPSVVIATYLILVYRKQFPKPLLVGIFLLIGTVLVQIGFRYTYYQEIFPNTYYLKMTGYPWYYRISRGIISAFQFILSLNWLIVLLVLIGTVLKKKKELFLFLILFLSVIFYSIYVGGDAWEYFGGSNRFISPAMPFFFILVSISFVSIFQFLKKNLRTPIFKINGLYYIFTLGYLALINFANFDMFLESILLKQPQFIPANKVNIERALTINSITNENATIAIQWAGTTPYFSKRTYIDLFGKNDKTIARDIAHMDSQMPFWMRLNYFYPGHMKWNYTYSIGKLQPDVIAESDLPKEATPYITNYDHIVVGKFALFVKKDSKYIDLSKVDVSREIPEWSPPYVLE